MIDFLKSLLKRKPAPEPRYCVNCAHFEPDGRSWPNNVNGSCGHESNLRRNPVSGHFEHIHNRAKDCRVGFGQCGTRAQFFSPRSPQ
jgi:hypothetical protein